MKELSTENKELLLKDLCARLPYGVICSIYRIDDYKVGWRDEKLTGYFYDGKAFEFYFGETHISIDNDISKIKPYLRPKSEISNLISAKEFTQLSGIDLIDWFNANYFDYRTDDEGKTMIQKGLALEAPKDMYS